LFRALDASKFWLLDCKKLIVETDAKYIKGMLNNPDNGSNTTINRWIDYILMYHFTLRYIPEKTFTADRLSGHDKQPRDEEILLDDNWILDPEDRELIYEYSDLDNNLPKAETREPLPFDDFKETIDIRGGYLISVRKFMNKIHKDFN